MQPQTNDKQPGGLATTAGAMDEEEHEQGWKHWGLMVLCCLPMIVILMLVVLGVWGAR